MCRYFPVLPHPGSFIAHPEVLLHTCYFITLGSTFCIHFFVLAKSVPVLRHLRSGIGGIGVSISGPGISGTGALSISEFGGVTGAGIEVGLAS